ncbi:hypothetical protein VCHA53O466_40301 [Vibrio chagasii]|nr:hypothetical protein VCHA53O466_40301 [Vibrio chagasii]
MIENVSCISNTIECRTNNSQVINTQARDAAENFTAIFLKKVLESNKVDQSEHNSMKDHTDNLSQTLLAEKLASSPSNAIVHAIEQELLRKYD